METPAELKARQEACARIFDAVRGRPLKADEQSEAPPPVREPTRFNPIHPVYGYMVNPGEKDGGA